MTTCKKCGKEHGMGLENMETGSFEPIDYCYDCLFTYSPIKEQIHLTEWGYNMCDAQVINLADEFNKTEAEVINKMVNDSYGKEVTVKDAVMSDDNLHASQK